MGSSCNSKNRLAGPSQRPYEVEANVYLALSENHVVKVLDCPANTEDSFKDICGTAIQIAVSETKHKDHDSKRALKNFVPDWFAYKNGETCLVEEIDIDEDKKPFRAIYGPPLTSHPTFIFAAKKVTFFNDTETRTIPEDSDEFFGPYGIIMRPRLEPHFYIKKQENIASYEGKKMRLEGAKPLTFQAKVMLAVSPDGPTKSNVDCVLSAKQLAHFMDNRRNWFASDVERYFDELCRKNLGKKKVLEKYENLNERKKNGFTHLDADTLFYKTVGSQGQTVELHKLGLVLSTDENGVREIVPKALS
ncbi:hypothetical protein AAMO2058_001414300 [Amorphochlora amoebiformis]